MQQWICKRMLTDEQCEQILLQVLLLKIYWLRRHAKVPFYTLGLASYLDKFGNLQELSEFPYTDDNIKRENQLLLHYFGELYQLVKECLTQLLQVDVTFQMQSLALPGFHIYEPHVIFKQSIAHIHKDLQFKALFKQDEANENTFSFTLPITVPEGSGLNFFSDKRPQKVEAFVAYQPGVMVLHSGLKTHQAVINCYEDDVERITLQGHGFRHNKRLTLYW